MKTKKIPQFVVGVPDGEIKHMEASWAQSWINIYDNGGIGYQGSHIPTQDERIDIKARIIKLKDLLRKRNADLDKAWMFIDK